MIRVQCKKEMAHFISQVDKRRLMACLTRVMRAASCEGYEIGLILGDNELLHQLNKTYANEDHATDVLSFPQRSMVGMAPFILGDICISVEMAVAQSVAKQHDLLYELFFLAVHGFCHLLGYDHATPQEEAIMFGLEASLREQWFQKGRIRKIDLPKL